MADDRESAAQLLTDRGYLFLVPRSLRVLEEEVSPVDDSASAPRWSRVGIWGALVLIFIAYFAGLLPWWGVAAMCVLVMAWSLLFEQRGLLPAYSRLLTAHGACRHYEVIRLAEELRRTGEALTPLVRSDIDFRAAGALWALERDAEAEALIGRHHEAMGEKAWRTRRACSLSYAHRPGAVAEMRRAAALADDALEKAIALDPPKPEERIELAKMVLEHEGGVREARALLEGAWTANPIAIAFRLMVSGCVAIEEHDFERATSELRSAARWVRWLSLGPGRVGMNAYIHVHLCIAEVLSGRSASAALLERARGHLEDRGRSDLLVKCERALASRRIPYR